MTRQIEPELLDQLPVTDPKAIRSRRDLRRLNFLMGHAGAMAALLRKYAGGRALKRLIDLGAGDGTFLLKVVRAWPSGRGSAMLVDRTDSVLPQTRKALEQSGWDVEIVTADVWEWLEQMAPENGAAMVANLFLHHFPKERLRSLFSQAALKVDLFASWEPRRSRFALSCSRLVWFVGCGPVTRHDAVASVRAGFREDELSKLWPAEGWQTQEGTAGLFSHFFVASRRDDITTQKARQGL